ncbi:hypothetical protein [Aquimarina aggregata]|uniref:hypothetical protein n=1 Tax=Aquimarina aggregata TaxID=1642818 RepID=UPI002490D301|nr:hypothetical protein [Aquimarina aggregata]
MKNSLYLLSAFVLFIIVSSCSNEEIDSQEVNDINGIIKTKVILPDSETLVLKHRNGKFINDKNYKQYQNYIESHENLVISDLGDNVIRVFFNFKEAKMYLSDSSDTNLDSINEKNVPLGITGEAILYDGKDNTGESITFRMGFVEGGVVTHQVAILSLARSIYEYNGNILGPQINMDNRISSIKLKRFAFVLLTKGEHFQGTAFLFSNKPDVFGNPREKSYNLTANPFVEMLNQDNSYSSVRASADVF